MEQILREQINFRKLIMKIALVECGTFRKELNEPIGIEVLAGTLKGVFNNAVLIKTFSLQITSLSQCLDELIKSDIVGISAQMGSHQNLKEILEHLTNKQGNRPLIVVGNILPTFASDYLLSEYPDIICVLGEGENSIVCIAEGVFIHAKSSDTKVLKHWLVSKNTPNLAININGKIIHTPRQVTNLLTIAHPSRDLLAETINRMGIARIESSRGCPWGKCSFCSIASRYSSGEWRPFSIRYVIDELEKLSSFGVSHPYFTDEDFIGNDIERITQLAREIIKAQNQHRITPNLGFFISTGVRTINHIGNKAQIIELFTLLKLAGLREVFLGIESGCKTQLLRYRKGVSPDLNAKIIRIIRDLDILVDPGFIMFDPEMSLAELISNLQFIRDSGLDNVDGRLTKPLLVLPQTVFADQILKKGVIEHTPTIDRLYYTYKFVDPLIQVIYNTFDQWEKEADTLIYAIQSRMRGEVISESQSAQDRETLRILRKLDIAFLEESISLVKRNQNTNSKLLRQELESAFHFSNKRDTIISKAQLEKAG